MEQPNAQIPYSCITSSSPPNYLTIVHEYSVLRIMQGTPGFPVLYGSSFAGPSDRLYVMELLGPSLESIQKQRVGQVIPGSELGPLAAQIVTNLEAMHQKGYLMIDIHAENFLLHQGRIYNVDLAWAAPITGRPATPSHCRSPGFAPAVETGFPRDDLVRLMYTLVWLTTGTLPWVHATTPEEADPYKIALSSLQICGMNGGWLVPAFRFVKSLGKTRHIDYNKLRSLLISSV